MVENHHEIHGKNHNIINGDFPYVKLPEGTNRIPENSHNWCNPQVNRMCKPLSSSCLVVSLFGFVRNHIFPPRKSLNWLNPHCCSSIVLVKRNRNNGCTNDVNQYRELLGFSMQIILLFLMQYRATSVRKLYNLLAAPTRALCVHVKLGRPSGWSVERSGGGPFRFLDPGTLIGIFRAKLHVPHGGATKTPKH